MTVSTEVSREEYTGNGVTTDFDYRFRVFSADELVVTVADTTENIRTLVLNTDYTVTGAGSRNGGKVKLVSALANNWRISIERELPVTQETDIRNQGNFFPEVHEDAWDKLTMLIQQAIGGLGLALRKPNWLAKYYDAKGNRISNLRDPVNRQDAATKQYVDYSVSNSAGHADDLFKRTIRVTEGYVQPLAPVAVRANMLLGFNDVGAPVPISGQTATADLAIKLASTSGAELIGYQANSSAQYRTVGNRLRDFVSLHDYWLPSDGEDFAPALNRALAASPNVLVPATGRHILKSTVSLPSGANIIGFGKDSCLSSLEAVSANGSEILTVLQSVNQSNIIINGVRIEGGCNANVTTKRNVRGVRFINCSDIRVLDSEVNNTGDWALSFEKCNNISVVNYRHRKSAGTLYGGRDGLHFLDCVDYIVNGADIESGDDMIGCTTETRDQRNGTILNVSGYSMIASGVIFNEEGSTTFSTVNVLVDGVNITFGKTVRNVVRVQSINPETNTTGVIVKNVRGVSYSHGLFISGQKLTKVTFSDIDVSSTGGHGVYINGAQDLRASGRGASQLSNFDGWNITNCKYFHVEPSSLGSAGWGCQVLNCSAFTMNGNIFNCGAGLYPSSSGGNCRVFGCSAYHINGGVYYGNESTSYYGLSVDEVQTGRVSDAVVTGGYIKRTSPRNFNAIQIAQAACSFGQSTSGVINSPLTVGCSLSLVSDGRYKVTFDTPFASTFYKPEVVASRNNAKLEVRTISRDVNSFTFQVEDASGTIQLANFINCEFKRAL
ncbi:TPA: hypothetical protein I9786_002839 [Serratia marcescens]|nr:hypothetical protein [Serratia marcescens]HAT5031502.1 hypothetical protein [Serratia marcescens]